MVSLIWEFFITMNKLVIDRAKWNVGNPNSSYLLDRGGMTLCCLGFLGLECGVSRDNMLGWGLPSNVNHDKWPKKLFETATFVETTSVFGDHSLWENVFVEINDSTTIDNDARELWIKEGFRQILNYDVEFVGEYLESKCL